MMRWYFDASAVLKFYKSEDGTENVYYIFGQYAGKGGVATSQYTAVETASAAQRLYNAGQMNESMKEMLHSGISSSKNIKMLPVSWDCLQFSVRLINRHNLRAGDAIQLSSALEYKSAGEDKTVFVCSDVRLNDAAQKEGLNVYDPAQISLNEWLKSK